ncbi:30S ribosomal protein S17e [Candidatus Woesearchaeota archaeon]|nr:30S ribosomal protein S17e [Candidatus Woesearchaeota archaeon]
MGRIKTTYLKRKTKELFKTHGDKVTADFSQNKEVTNKFTKLHSKKLRNIIAGYVTRLKQKEQ